MIEYKLVGSQGFYFDLGVHLKTVDCQVNKVQVVMYLYLLHITYISKKPMRVGIREEVMPLLPTFCNLIILISLNQILQGVSY